MQIVPLFVSALASYATVTRAQRTTPCLLSQGQASAMLDPPRHAFDQLIGRSQLPDRHPALAERVAGLGYGSASTQNNMCIDVKNSQLKSGAAVQLWQCMGGQNQQWRVEGPLFQTNNNMCLDLPNGWAYDGAPLQVWECDGSNKNQHWTQVGSGLHWGGGGNWCVDVTQGAFYNGGRLQLWTCYAGSANQAFNIQSGAGGQPNTAAVTTDTTTYLGYPAMSLSAFVEKYPACAPYEGALQAAGQDQGINPTFLGAIAMVESGCNNYPGNQYGAFQWMDASAALFYVGAGKNIQNFWDAAYGAARYFRALLAQDNNDLWRAMRDYNGPIGSGGAPDYQSRVLAYMAGNA